MNEQDQALMKLLAEVKVQTQSAVASALPVKEWTDKPPTPDACVSAIVHTGANLPLAAERLGIPEEQLIAIVSTDPTAPGQLMAQMRTMATIKAMHTLNLVEAELQGKLPLMEPYDLSKTYTALLDKVVTATDRNEHTENVNVTATVLSKLPPAAREAFKSLMDDFNSPGDTAESVPATVIENEPPLDVNNGLDDISRGTASDTDTAPGNSLVHPDDDARLASFVHADMQEDSLVHIDIDTEESL